MNSSNEVFTGDESITRDNKAWQLLLIVKGSVILKFR